ncbi:MAG: beta strand repeat-containing protein, partial [Dolichospermum sp.]
SASLGLTTASVSLNTITFSKGDGSTFNLTVDTGSGGGGGVPAGTISGSAQITELGFVSSSVTASSLVTASISGQLLTFTKGNGTQFNLTLPTGSGGGQAVTASYGAFSDTTTQSGSATVAYPFKFDTVDVVDGVTLSGSTGLQVNSSGVYNIQFSAQGVQGAGAGIGNIWFRQNGADIPNSDTQFTIPSNQKFVAAWNIFATASAGDNFEIIWRSDSANTTWAFITGSGTSPNSPSIIATVNRVDVGGTADLTPLNQFSASINAYTQSNDAKVNSLIAATGSYAIFEKPSIQTVSGSVLITANTFTSGAASITHISGSSQNLANILFKNSNTAGSTIVSGSFNLFTNPAAPAAGRINYLESSNIFLNDSGFLPTVTASVLTVGGFYPRMRNNMWLGTGPWTINTNAVASSSVQAGSYNNNLFLGSTGTTINTLGNTSGIGFSHNIMAQASATINAPSRSLAQVAAGDSGSTTVNFLNNLALGGNITYNGPVSASSAQAHNIQANNIQGTLTLNLQSGSRGYTISNNVLNGTLTLNDNIAFTPTLGANSTISQTNINGAITLTNRASASFNLTANNLGGFTITNEYDSSTNGTSGRSFVFQGNVILGFLANNIYFSGSAAGTGTANDRGRGFYGNLIGGSRISASVIGDGNRHFLASAVWG